MRIASLLVSFVLASMASLPMAASAQEDPVFKKIQALEWKVAPATGNIAGKATIALNDGLGFLDAKNTSEFLVLLGNLPQTDTYTVAPKDFSWFSVFSFVDEGYVKDDEKIDADALLAVLKENNVRSMEERAKRGLPKLYLDGWFIAPRYDSESKRLEWATLLHSDGGEKTVNFSTKILGRRGHMDAILVSEPQSLEADIKTFKTALKGFDYVSGERYSEWSQGDKVAAYGLGALILGGAAAVATKKGFWAVIGGVLAAGWKLIAAAAVAVVAGIGALFKRKKP